MYSPGKAVSQIDFGMGDNEGGHFNGAVLNEMASQKSKFARKLKDLEKQIDQLRSEKSQLTQVLETQRQNFKFAL